MPEIHPTPNEYARLELILDGVLPGPLTVRIPQGTAGTEYGTPDELQLTDAEGTPVARLTVTAYGEGRATGRINPVRPREDGLFRHLRRTPDAACDELLALAREVANPQIGALVLPSVPDAASVRRLAKAAEAYDGVILLPTLFPERWEETADRPVSARVGAAALVRSAMAVAPDLGVPCLVVPVPLPDPEAAERVTAAYGTPIDVELTSSGAFDERVGAMVGAEHRPLSERGAVVFFTGLSGSGKSTLARRLRDLLSERGDQRTVTLLDGDVVRRHLSKGLGFSRQDRERNIDRIGFVASEIARAGGLVICAPIAPYAQGRADAREMATTGGASFVLVHVATPLEECERRDRKGLYAKARAGEIAEFTGISDPYEEPTDAEVTVDTTGREIDEVARTVLDHLVGAEILTEETPDTGFPDRGAP